MKFITFSTAKASSNYLVAGPPWKSGPKTLKFSVIRPFTTALADSVEIWSKNNDFERIRLVNCKLSARFFDWSVLSLIAKWIV